MKITTNVFSKINKHVNDAMQEISLAGIEGEFIIKLKNDGLNINEQKFKISDIVNSTSYFAAKNG